jgi:lipid A Kdo2 1-phosphate O-methyltransferase
MALIEEFNSQGNFLFRRRTYIPGIILLLSFFFIPDVSYWGGSYHSNLWYTLGCLSLSIIGQIIRGWTIGHTPENTSGRNTEWQVADTINKTGIYSLVRHPLYLGNFFIYLGVVILLKSFLFAIVFILFFYLYYERIMFAEETFLREKFGDDYLSWANSTPAFIPGFRNFKPAELSFSLRNVFKREYAGIFGIIFIYSFMDILILYFNEKGRFLESFFSGLRIEQIWFLGFGIAFYILMRFLVKGTNLMEVEGRW